MNPLYSSVAVRAGGRCEYCHAPEEVFNFAFEVEHLLPQSRGGTDALENLALACHACNRFKSDFVTGFDEETQQETSLFNPRQQIWHEHFTTNSETAEIVGISSIGRSTIARLQMNRPRQVNARQRWIQIGLYP